MSFAVDLILENRNITFDFAHGFYSADVIDSLLSHLKAQTGRKVKNVYFEFSRNSGFMNKDEQDFLDKVILPIKRGLYSVKSPFVGFAVVCEKYSC